MKTKEIVLKEVKSIEYYTHLWRAYIFYFTYHLFKYFYDDESILTDVKLPKIQEQVTDVIYLVVNYPQEIDYRLKLDSFNRVTEIFLSDKRSSIVFQDKQFDHKKYFEKVALKVIEDNELVDQFLIKDSMVTIFPQKFIRETIKDIEENFENWYFWNDAKK